jgi:hypothetical protein
MAMTLSKKLESAIDKLEGIRDDADLTKGYEDAVVALNEVLEQLREVDLSEEVEEVEQD